MKQMLLLLFTLIGVQTIYGTQKTGLVWVQDSFLSEPDLRLQEEKRIMSKIENKEGKQVVRQNAEHFQIPRETFESEVKLGEILDLLDRQSEENILIGNSSIKLKKIVQKASPYFFSPELEKAYLKLSLEYWHQKKKENARLFMKKALTLNPFFETKWQPPDDESVERHLFEAELANSQKKVSSAKSCRLQVPASLQHSVWINGFFVTRSNLRIKPGLFLMIKKEAEGALFERLVRCDGSDISLENKSWSPCKLGGRLEMILPHHWKDFNETIVLQEEKGRVTQWLYRDGKGLVSLPRALIKLPQIKERPLDVINFMKIPPVEKPKKWYTNKVLIGVALGLLGAATVIHKSLETQGKPVVVPLVLK